MNDTSEYIAVGKFGKARGVSGEVYIHLLTDNPDRFESDVTFWTEDDSDGYSQLEIESVNEISGRVVLKIAGVDNPEAVKRELTNLFIYVKREDLGAAPEGRHYHFDLVGCRVEDENKKKYGEVVAVEEFPANDLLVVETEDKKRHYLPMVKQYIIEIDTGAKKIVVNPSGGIFGETDEI